MLKGEAAVPQSHRLPPVALSAIVGICAKTEPTMRWMPSRTMVRIIEVLRDGPRDRAEIAAALKLHEPATAAVLTAMQYRQLVLKEGNRHSLSPGTASQDIAATADTLAAKTEGRRP
jgi:hypothetical protein